MRRPSSRGSRASSPFWSSSRRCAFPRRSPDGTPPKRHRAPHRARRAPALPQGRRRRGLAPHLLLCTLAVGALPQLVRRTVGKRAPFADLPEGDVLAEILVRVLFHGIGAPGATAG